MLPQESEQAIADRTTDLLGLGDVQRWGVIKTLRQQSVAEHSFNVAVIAMELAERLECTSRSVANIVMWAIVHDAPETLTGDVDGKFKRDNPIVRDTMRLVEDEYFPWYRDCHHTVPEFIRHIVKTADRIEAIQFIKVWGLGPRADDVYRELLSILFEEIVPSLAVALAVEKDEVVRVVYSIVHHSVSESNSCQLRRFRKVAVPD